MAQSIIIVLSCLVASTLALSWNSLVHSDVFSPEISMSRSRSGHASVLLKELSSLLDDPEVLQAVYANYLRLHEKNKGEDDDQLYLGSGSPSRLQIFRNNLINVATHNLEAEAGQHTWIQGVNQFTDMSDEELERYTSRQLNLTEAIAHLGDSYTHVDFGLAQAAEKDWRKEQKVSPVKDQGQCGSCVSFATVASLESALLIAGKNQILSEQQLVDCAKKSCDGGDWPFAYDYMKKTGVTTSSSYPYTSGKSGKSGSCQSKSSVAFVDSYGYVSPRTESGVIAAAEKAPIVGGVAVDSEWYRYKGGLYNGKCAKNINHAILIAGYTSNSFIIKNSWATSWGDKGFMNLPRGSNKCGINDDTVWMKPRL